TWWGKVRSHIKAVNGVSFDVFPGETLGLVGESGCGKTTLSKTILQLLTAREGTVTLNGQDLGALPPGKLRQCRKDFQIVFQDPYGSLNPRLMIGAAIREPLDQFGIGKTRKERTERVVALLEMVGLSAAHYSRYPHQFSGGERQRISIARALASEPKLLILDEPVSSLDVSIQAQVLNLLNELKEKQGLTYLFISHDLSVVRFMADRILVMQDGRIEETGDADALFRNPTSDYTRSLLAAIPKGPAMAD
ncbi:MAG: ATP-binding cassette domain-containing protein, partial [Bacteroidota bacterium]